jgi:phytoene dehydrogenase-like protein
MSSTFDTIVIGAGHNGMVCALDLARGGRKVLLVESAAQVGGAAVTRSFATGFRVSGCAHLLHALPESLVRDYALEQHGLRFAAKSLPSIALSQTDPALTLGPHQLSGGSDSQGDAPAYASLRVRMMRFGRLMHALMGLTPPRLSLARWNERLDMVRLALQLRLLGKADMRELLRIAGMNAYDLLDDNFSSAALKGALAWDATLGADYGPRSPGTVLTWLYRLAGEYGAGSSAISQPVGGMGAFSEALATACRAAGVEIRLSCAVSRILVEGDRARGVQVSDGSEVHSRNVVSSADLRSTFLRLLGAEHLDTGFVRRVHHFRSRGLVAKLHLALSALPRFQGLEASAHGGRLLISPSLDYLELAFNPSKYRQIPQHPAMEITLPSVNDTTLAPPGQHVLSALVQFVPYDLGADPAAARAQLLENVLATLERYASGIRDLVLAHELLTPSDIEREFGLPGGHWHKGALTLDQFFVNRPVPHCHQYQTPLAGLFVCGASSHPGGSLMGIAGRNAARSVLAEGA